MTTSESRNVPCKHSPATLSGLVAAAIADARGLNQAHYKPLSADWHNPVPGDKCLVCLAGCVLAGRLEVPSSEYATPNLFPKHIVNKLDALDNIRIGNWQYGFERIHKRSPSPAVSELLSSLPNPSHPHFCGWREFELHLHSLEALLPRLHEIDQAAAAEASSHASASGSALPA